MINDESLLEEHEEGKSDPEKFIQSKELVKERCRIAGINTKDFKQEDVEVSWLEVEIPAGRDKVSLFLRDEDQANALLSIDFEKYSMLGEYMGIYSYTNNTIEAGFSSLGNSPISSFILNRRLFENNERQKKIVNPIVLKQNISSLLPSISLGSPSKEFCIFLGLRLDPICNFTFRIEGLETETHEKTIHTLEKLANAIFFQIDLKLGISLGLKRERFLHNISRSNRIIGKRDDLTFPSREYDPEPMSLYWYAKSAKTIPLLQYLAYYQVLEFYMPTYTYHETIKVIRNIIIDPRFTPDKETQIARILETLRPFTRGFGDEKYQLEAVLRRCISTDELREFYTSEQSRVEFYSEKFKIIAPQKIPLKNKESDLLTDTALRLYEIRCRIVHTKDHGDGKLQPLLPYSKEVKYLNEDIALIEYIATAVLIASSRAITES